MSTFLVSLYFDNTNSDYLKSLISRIAVRTGNDAMVNIPPHITVGMIQTDDQDKAVRILENIAESLSGFDIQLASVGLFGNKIVFIQPVLSKELYDLNRLVNESYVGMIHPSSKYLPNEWMPHITLAKHLSNEEQIEVIRILQNERIFRKVHVNRIGIATTNPYKDILVKEI